MKLMYAVWSGSPTTPLPLLDPALREELAGVGVERLVVGLDDTDVAQAQLRLSTYDEPVTGVLSLWTQGDDHEPVTRVLQGAVDDLAGWEVEERCPLPPPTPVDGGRADALVNVALLRRPDELAHEVWLDRWLNHHTAVAIETQATFGYVQNVVVRALVDGQRRVDALVEEFFPTAATTDLHAFYGSEGDDAVLSDRMTRMLTSVATFGADRDIDVVPTSRYEFALDAG